jgi:hypothetical protein
VRSISATAKRAIFAGQTGEVFVCLLTLSHPSLDVPIRVCNDAVSVTSNAVEFIPYPFQLVLPDEDDGVAPQVTLEIDNVDRQIVAAVRRANGEPISVELSIVLASQPDIVEAGPFSFKLRSVNYDKSVVSGTLQFEDLLNEPMPGDTMTPSRFPGLF